MDGLILGLSEKIESIFYAVYEEYKRIRKKEGYWYDWEDIAQTVYSELLSDQNERMYKHIVIDEGQDLSPIMLKSLVNTIPQDGSLTFFWRRCATDLWFEIIMEGCWLKY